ncbi:HTD2 family dehydratase [Arthrobacter sp. Z4-13]
MFAGGSVTITRPVRVGEVLTHEAIVDSIAAKRGRNGDFTMVCVSHVFRGADNSICLEEKQNLVFIEPGPRTPQHRGSVPATVTAPVGPPLRRTAHGWGIVTDPTLLMRFSAVTANSHRIHYDWPYATETEGYAGLVVHGPFSTLLLAEALRLEGPGATPRQLQHRNMSPLFCGEEALISLTTTADHRDAVLRREGVDLVTLSTQTASA